jgi:hypothetical protein
MLMSLVSLVNLCRQMYSAYDDALHEVDAETTKLAAMATGTKVGR